MAGQPRDREVSLGGPRVRVSALLYGGPALSLAEFADYKPDLIIGASFAVMPPLAVQRPEADPLPRGRLAS